MILDENLVPFLQYFPAVPPPLPCLPVCLGLPPLQVANDINHGILAVWQLAPGIPPNEKLGVPKTVQPQNGFEGGRKDWMSLPLVCFNSFLYKAV